MIITSIKWIMTRIFKNKKEETILEYITQVLFNENFVLNNICIRVFRGDGKHISYLETKSEKFVKCLDHQIKSMEMSI